MDLDGLLSVSSLQALSDLLNPKRDEDDDSEDEILSNTSVARQGPGQIGPPKKQEQEDKVASQRDEDKWTEEEVSTVSGFDDRWDPREQPEYQIIFKQQVTAEDVFLGMSRKDPSTACCEDMLIKIILPDTDILDITLDIKEKFLDLQTPKYKLGLHLPHPVDNKNGKACFNSEKEALEVTLTMKRTLDFINFA
ncbi:dynein axonemal assembly factor 6 [Protopterus annectens]|uniref:dynein axonemal assembly factor 6 n=1 Tax=Protopterus annectens TaxID=7888 RepID=UPI001CFA8FB9|nr:dynein axonemal assembly factor 6 [Protopterus annectens]XP_043913538.1 dynein axonemal assembly factor 6 [Protopterus annectens]